MNKFAILQTELTKKLPQLELRVGEEMHQHTTFRVGGPVPLMALPKSVPELQTVLSVAAKEGISPFFLGKGSNLLVSDRGAEVFVVKLAGGLSRLEMLGETGLYVGSGVTLAQAAVFARERGLTGLEFAHGIPGTMGGGVFMNAGAYDGELSQVIDWVEYLDEQGELHRLSCEQAGFGYRRSVFCTRPWVVVGAMLSLTPGEPDRIRTKMEELAQKRRSRQPLEYPSAGSTFKRPQGHFAGRLIEQCGLKGMDIGGAQVSEKHAGFIVNRGTATCSDILALIHLVRETVLRETGVLLEPEVRMLGCFPEEEKEGMDV